MITLLSFLPKACAFPSSFTAYSPSSTRMLKTKEIDECTKIIITPDSADWDPHNESYALNQE
jgi:hypothetical protein